MESAQHPFDELWPPIDNFNCTISVIEAQLLPSFPPWFIQPQVVHQSWWLEPGIKMDSIPFMTITDDSECLWCKKCICPLKRIYKLMILVLGTRCCTCWTVEPFVNSRMKSYNLMSWQMKHTCTVVSSSLGILGTSSIWYWWLKSSQYLAIFFLNSLFYSHPILCTGSQYWNMYTYRKTYHMHWTT